MRISKYADLSPLMALVIILGIVFLFDRQRGDRVQEETAATEAAASRRAVALGTALDAEVKLRLGALESLKSGFLAAQDSVAERALVATMDSTSARMQLGGLTGLAIVVPDRDRVLRPTGTAFRLGMLRDTAIEPAYQKAVRAHLRAATRPIGEGTNRKVFVFDPILKTDGDSVLAVLVAELDPRVIYGHAVAQTRLDTIGTGVSSVHALIGPDSSGLSTRQYVPSDWLVVTRAVPVADSEWHVQLYYEPPDLRGLHAEQVAIWVIGIFLAIAVAAFLHFIRLTITTQKEEIARRQAAEEAARSAAAEARERAKQARELAAQLEAAQRASQRLSTSLNPDDVVELFLGGVAEILDADVASLYTFEEEGEVLVGRRRMVFRDIEGVADRLREEDITQVRAPVALLPTLGEAVSTGEPYVVENADHEGRLVPSRAAGAETASASVTIPLLIAGHTVGVASWEVFSGPRKFPPALVAFGQALGAPAAAALRTAELFLSLETERRKAAREAVRFGAVLDQMADGVIVVDAAGRLERSNASAEELLGQDLGQAPVDDWPARFELVSIEGRPLGPGEFPLTRALRGERVRRATFIVRSEWGTERHLSASAGPIMASSGEPGGAAMVLRDVTDEHQYAEMLRHTNRELRRQAEVLEQVNHQLREATKAKDQFLAVMSHELRTPINAIMGYSDLLDLGVKGPLNDDQRGMLSRVRETSRHLLGLINEVLDLAKIGAGRMDLVIVELDVAKMVERAAQQILPLAASKGLSLMVEEPQRGPLIVRADETRLTQIIVNLLSNAVKFTSTGSVTVDFVEAHGRVTINVHDTGPGIPADQAERIFEEFYQVEGGLSRTSGGTGLGLAIARRFARLMQGDITVQTDVGRGSIFSIHLPGAEAAVAVAQDDAQATVVLFAHHEQALKRIAEDLRGIVRVIGATEPGQIAALARRERPCLVALDALADDHGAWRALAALQAETATASIPTLLYAHEDANGETALDLGVLTVLSKPLTVEHATEAVLGDGPLDQEMIVVVADDDPDVRRILGEALAAAGCDVRTAASGGEVLDVARRVQPDIAIVDLLMPGMDGVDAIAAMRAEPALQGVQIFALVSREMSPDEMARLTSSMEALGRGRRARVRATADMVRIAAEANGTGSRPGAVA